ncbi:uncharacterized protein BJ212DRAFT_1343335 [Suillus subaureus]|uniref:Shugoshin C-terminal domain-containing protein n=1 Tax=Suillus subaureus TaxID=48587 RepID=A0A9P7JFV1_9AGAM|nr:uncharacterized protein BJ212DRAFT_1343335 [Suillus subaureus]KAG1819835.1 hypothetical protein BJ212DRAFT_1343335 [Suillus subaureus]
MSRRDSRLSLNVRQNDALSEFENFKKKFLLANKHITKLNSTLSVRIEELNAQISTLYVENLRLRASEIALTAQLKKEQEKSRKIMADADAATANLVKHLTFLRQSLGIAPGVASPAKQVRSASRARRPFVDPNASPQMPKLSRAPNIPGIYEDEEFASSPEGDEEEAEHIPSPTIRRKTKSRLAASRLPLPARVSSPPPLPTPPQASAEERGSSNKRKTGRRESGLLNVSTDGGDRVTPPRAASPAFGSPARREAGLAEDDEEREAVRKSRLPPAHDDDMDYVQPTKKEREKKMKQIERELPSEEGEAATSSRVQERKRRRHEDYSGLKDVTNSPRSRAMLPPLDTNASDRDRQHTPDTDGATPISGVTSLATTRSFLSTPATTPPPTISQISQLPTPQTSSSPIPPPCASTSEEAPVGGRERRTRKSVNYAEPKLNTKMRKPDGPPMQPTTALGLKKRSSTTSVQSDDPERRPSSEGFSQSKTSIPVARSSSGTTSSSSSATANTVVKRKKSRPQVEVDDDESEGAQADAEYGNINGWVNVEGRRRSAHHSAVRRALEADDGRRHSLAV